MLGQEEEILRPRTQRGQCHHHHGQAMVQIRPEPPLRRVPPEIGGRGGDDLDVHGLSPHRPEPPDPLLFDGLQELALQRQGEGLDLVQEHRPPRRRLQQAGLGAFGIGERPGFKAQEFRLHTASPGWPRS